MRLRYEKTVSSDSSPVVLEGGDNFRIELHIRCEDDGTATLIAVAGLDNLLRPEKLLQQGPYQVHDQAVAARRAIAAELIDDGYHIVDRHSVWSLAVQRSIRESRARKRVTRANYDFKAEDVFLDW